MNTLPLVSCKPYRPLPIYILIAPGLRLKNKAFGSLSALRAPRD